MIEPDHRAAIILPGPRPLGHIPDVRVRLARRHQPRSSHASVWIRSALGLSAIRHTVWMHAVGMARVIPKVNDNGVPDFCSNQRSHDSQVVPLLCSFLLRVERFIRIFAVDGLAINIADSSLPML